MGLMQTQHLGMRPEPQDNQFHIAALEALATYDHRSSGHPTKTPPSCEPGSEREAIKEIDGVPLALSSEYSWAALSNRWPP